MLMSWEPILNAFRLAYRQKSAFYQILQLLRELPWKLVISTSLLFCELLGCIFFDTPYLPHGEPLDLRGYAMVVNEEFSGDALNTDVWKVHDANAGRGFYSPSQVSVHNDCLYLTGAHRQDGTYGKGWYSGAISLIEQYTTGYFEIRCKCSKGDGFWSAFWMMAPNAYNHAVSNGGIGGAEIDIMESLNAGKLGRKAQNSVTQTVHCNGWDDDPETIDSRILGFFHVRDNDIYDTFHTYGMKWTKDEYIFYIDSIESARSSFGNGVSASPEELIVSLELPLEEKMRKLSADFSTQMIVDYVRVYQDIKTAS